MAWSGKPTSTKSQASTGVRGIIYGPGGVGKTRLAISAPRPFVVNVEHKLQSLDGHDIAVGDVSRFQDAIDMLDWFVGSDDHEYETCFVDSITKLAELYRKERDGESKDGRIAYYATIDRMTELLDAVRKLKCRNIIMLAQCDRNQDDVGAMRYGPSMPGKQLGNSVCHSVDYLWAIRDDGVMQTRRCKRWEAQTALAARIPAEIKPEGPENVVNLTKVFDALKVSKA